MNNYTEYSFSDNLKTNNENEEVVEETKNEQVQDPPVAEEITETAVEEEETEAVESTAAPEEIIPVNENASEMPKPKAKKLSLGWIFLIPAAIMIIYDILVATDVLPVWIYFDHYRIKLLRITETAFMTFLSLLAFVVIPLIGLIYTVRRHNFNLSLNTPRETYTGGEYTSIFNANKAEDAYAELKEESEYTPVAAKDVPTSQDGELLEFFYSLLNLADANARSSGYGAGVEYAKKVAPKSIVENFCKFAQSKGVAVPDNAARAIFSAMASSKVLYVVGVKDRKLARRVISLVAEYFSAELHIENVGQNTATAQNLAVRKSKNEEYYVESEFIVDVYSANHYPNAVCFAALDGVDSTTLSSYFGEYMQGIDIPDRERFATVVPATGKSPEFVNLNKMKLAPNVWYFIIPSDETVYSEIPEVAMPLAFFGITIVEPEITTIESRLTLSAPFMMGLARASKENNFIPEEYWKKIDSVEEYIAKRISFSLDNKTVRRMESYAAVCLAAGASIYEAVDGVLAAKVLVALAHCEKDSINGEEDSISALIDRVFGLDNMPLSLELLRRLGVA